MKKVLFSVLLGTVVCTGALAQVTPYGWRGPEHNGYYPDKGLLNQWPEAGPQMVFETEDAGKGYSSPLVVNDRVYITGLNETVHVRSSSAITYKVRNNTPLSMAILGSSPILKLVPHRLLLTARHMLSVVWQKSYVSTLLTERFFGRLMVVRNTSVRQVCGEHPNVHWYSMTK